MTSINQIETRILEMDGGEFQKLCDSYLSRIGYGKPNSFGIQDGSNKVIKGTPDTYFEKKDGKIAFAEYTTQKTRVFNKLKDDLEKCINKINGCKNKDVIDEIVFCYTTQISSTELIFLRDKCKVNGLTFTNFSLSALANGLTLTPDIVNDFLNFSLDSGQILSLESFPTIYKKCKFSTSLETKLQFRENELQEINKILVNNDVVILLGKPGVGKTRLALEVCRRFILSNPDYEAFSILNFSKNLFDDIKNRFSGPGKYLLFVDDANRVIKFEYFIDLLRIKKDNQEFKIVTTVRDYAYQKINNDIGYYPHKSVEIEQLKDEQIKEIVKEEFGILNHHYLDRIIQIASGNPRLAMMASAVARESNNLASIYDASALYDEYFKSIKYDLENIGDINILKTAGIISFLRNVDKTNKEMMSKISQSFDISSTDFWSCAYQLNQLEFVDVYENQIVKFSDQVLSTYFFYISVFKEKILDFSDIINNYFPEYQSKIDDALFPVISVFDQQKIISLIEPEIKNLWLKFKQIKNEEYQLLLGRSYWFIIPTETLQLISIRLKKIFFEPLDEQLFLSSDSNRLNNWQLSLELQILGSFSNSQFEYIEVVLDILLDYVSDRPSDIFGVLRIIKDYYGFRKKSNDQDLKIQNKVIDLILERIELTNDYVFIRLFLAVCNEFLKTHYDYTQYKGNNSITFYEFNLLHTENLFHFRNKLLISITSLYDKYPDLVLKVLEKYIFEIHEKSSLEILFNDSIVILNFISQKFTPNDFNNIIFLHNYSDFLDFNKIKYDQAILKVFSTKEYEIYSILIEDKKKLRRIDYKTYKTVRTNNVIRFFHNYSEKQIGFFIQTCKMLKEKLITTQNYYQLTNGFSYILQVLSKKSPEIFESLLLTYLQNGDFFSIYPSIILSLYLENFGVNRAYTMVQELSPELKLKWELGYYEIKPIELINKDDIPLLLDLFNRANNLEVPYNLDFIINFINFDKRIVAKTVKILLNKMEPRKFLHPLILIFNPNTEINKGLVTFFKEDVEVLKTAYLFVIGSGDHDDFDSTSLCKIIELEESFFIEYIKWQNESSSRLDWHRDEQNYSKIWDLPNYKNIILEACDFIFHNYNHYAGIQLTDLLLCGMHQNASIEIMDKRNSLIDELIIRYKKNGVFLEYLFEALSNLSDEQRLHFIFSFLEVNQSLGDFERIALESRSRSWTGSAVPMYQNRIDFFTMLLPKLTNKTFLGHKLFIENKIFDLEKQKQYEKIRDFCEI